MIIFQKICIGIILLFSVLNNLSADENINQLQSDNSDTKGIKIINIWRNCSFVKKSEGVNCYLLNTGNGFILIDTGAALKNRQTGEDFVKELENAGCVPGKLNMIILTHADSDHVGYCTMLREKYGTRILMHRKEKTAAEKGDMFQSREKTGVLTKTLIRVIFFFYKKIYDIEVPEFSPDILVDDDYDLSAYGIGAKILHLPGHSSGSIGILTYDGNLFCGDLFTNLEKPELNSLVDDSDAMKASLEKIKKLQILKVYPGHGKPFSMNEYLYNIDKEKL
jgi:hydroxyacylglutathione hydrolase